MQTMTLGTINSAVNAVQWKDGGLSWSDEAFAQGVKGAVVSAGAGIARGLSQGALDGIMNATVMKHEGFSIENKTNVTQLTSFAASAVGESVNYAASGTFTLNVANLGFLGDVFGNKQLGQSLSEIGLELHLGRDGITSNIGSGGMDASLGTIGNALKGLAVVGTNALTSIYENVSGNKGVGETLRSQYGYGDAAQKGQLFSVLLGMAELDLTTLAEGADAYAETVTENGKRVIRLAGYREGMSADEQLQLGVVLGHEAYRNGVVDAEAVQAAETKSAVEAHTTMAMRMLGDGKFGVLNETIVKDINAYIRAQSGEIDYADYVNDNYDSSADYWKLVKRTDGTYGVIKDGLHSLIDEDGNVIIKSILDMPGRGGKLQAISKYTSDADYQRSFGMLMGMYPNINGGTTNDYDNLVKTKWKNAKGVIVDCDTTLLAEISKAMLNAREGSIDVNPFLMTYKDVANGIGVTKPGAYNSWVSSVKIKNEKDEVVGTIYSDSFLGAKRQGEIDYTMVENMVPQAGRMSAATFQMDAKGNVTMYGLGSTLPDDVNKGVPMLADGSYRYVVSIHDIQGNYRDPYKALRIMNYGESRNATFAEVTGPQGKGKAVAGVNYNPDGTWGKYQDSMPGLYINNEGIATSQDTNLINGHLSNNDPWKYGTGSEGCMTWYSTTYEKMIMPREFEQFGTFKINRQIFGYSNRR